MKKAIKILIVISLILFIYYVISLLVMNNNVYMIHYYSYDNIEEAKKNNGLINENVPYELKGFSKEQEEIIRKNVRIWISKSNYQEFFGFLVYFSHEDENMRRVNIDLINEKNISLLDGEIQYHGHYEGFIYGASFDVSKKDETINLEVIKRQNGNSVKLGSIIFNLE